MAQTPLLESGTEVRRISVMWLCRNNGDTLPRLLATLAAMEAGHRCEFEYFVGENGSDDDTVPLLRQFLATREGRLVTPGNTAALDRLPRIERIARLRNALLDAVRPLVSDWVLLVDTGIHFDPGVLARLFALSPTARGIAMLCAYGTEVFRRTPDNGQRITQFHYYDTYAFRGEDDIGHWPHCVFAACRKCAQHVPRRVERPHDGLLRVNSAFGGLALVDSRVLNLPDVRWEATREGDELVCEHIHFCRMLRQQSGRAVAVACDVPVYWEHPAPIPPEASG
jgi:glycosyltransferase involved in cell wall biosynthesis